MQPPSPCCACLEGREEPRVDGWSGMGKSGPETSRLTSPAAARCVRVGPSAVAARSCGDETLVRPASPPPPRGVTFMRVRVSSRVFVSARPRPRHPVRGLPAHHEPAREPSHGCCGLCPHAARYAVVRAALAWIRRPRGTTDVPPIRSEFGSPGPARRQRKPGGAIDRAGSTITETVGPAGARAGLPLCLSFRGRL